MVTCKNIFVPLVNQFIIMFAIGTVEAMIGPHLKKYGATEFDVGLTFLLLGFMVVSGNFLVAMVSVECLDYVLSFDRCIKIID